jgi:hypothetical protein
VGPGDWEKDLKTLADADIRGYQDPNQLRKRVGQQGVWEDGATITPSGDDVASESTDFTLFNEDRTKHDGTGETRRTLSWIWTFAGTGGNSDDGNNDILRVEWAKSRARAARASEDVLLPLWYPKGGKSSP